jgi:membrane protein YdbS with pleckstrin-like domain
MSSPTRKLLDGEQLLFEGRPDWRSWAALTVLGWLLVPLVVGIVILLVLGAKKRGLAWMVSSHRIEVERGWLSRRIDTVELWRVKDVEFRQGILDRIAGVATLVVYSHDEELPVLALRGLPGDRDLYDQLTNAVMAARQQRQVLNVNS